MHDLCIDVLPVGDDHTRQGFVRLYFREFRVWGEEHWQSPSGAAQVLDVRETESVLRLPNITIPLTFRLATMLVYNHETYTNMFIQAR